MPLAAHCTLATTAMVGPHTTRPGGAQGSGQAGKGGAEVTEPGVPRLKTDEAEEATCESGTALVPDATWNGSLRTRWRR
jgi:hypothetical protein